MISETAASITPTDRLDSIGPEMDSIADSIAITRNEQRVQFVLSRIAIAIDNLRLTKQLIMAIIIKPNALAPRSNDSSVSRMIGREPSLSECESFGDGGNDLVDDFRE